MILSIRGTSGAGKSTLARGIMAACRDKKPIMAEGRRKPIGYEMLLQEQKVRVLGHYEIANGGFDTVPIDLGYTLVGRWARMGNVVYEGKTMRDNRAHVRRLARNFPVVIIFLTAEVQECVDRIHRRLGPTGKPHNIAPRSVEAMARKCAKDADWFEREMDLPVHRFGSAAEALPLALQILAQSSSE